MNAEMIYDAFISYAHGEDSRVAKALQDGLHAIAKPWEALNSLRISRDETHLPLGNGLEQSVAATLDSSSHLILLASPRAARSPWVQFELQRFLNNRPVTKILIVHLSGDLVWDPSLKDYRMGPDRAFPMSESSVFAVEPLHLDLRWAQTDPNLTLDNPRFRDAVATLAAALRGVPKEQLVGSYLQDRLRLRRNQRINLGFRGALGFGGTAALLLVLPRTDLDPMLTLFIGFSLAGSLGALSSGLGLRGVASFAVAFAALLPFYTVANFSPYNSSALELSVLSLLCVLGFTLAGMVGVALSRRARWKHGAFTFGFGGLVAATIWLGFPEWRARGLETQFFGPWPLERAQIAADFLRSGKLFVNLVPFAIGTAIGGLLLGLRLADHRIELPLQPLRPLPMRLLKKIPSQAWYAGFAGLAFIGIICIALRQSSTFQLRSIANALQASEFREAFDAGLHVTYGVDDPEVFRLVLRCRRNLIERGMTRQAEEFSVLLSAFMREYAGYTDQFYDRWDGLANIARSFVEVGAREDLKRLLETAERTASTPRRSEMGSSSVYDHDLVNALVAVSGAWAIYGDTERSVTVLARAKAASWSGGQIIPETVAQVAGALLQKGNVDAAKRLFTTLGVSPCTPGADQAEALADSRLWPEDCQVPELNRSQDSFDETPTPDLLYLKAVAAKKANDLPGLNRVKTELHRQLQEATRNPAQRYEDLRVIVQILKALIVAGDLETGLRLAESSGQDQHEVYLELARGLIERGARTEAHDVLVRAWKSLHIDSGYSPNNAGPLDQIGELLVEVGDLRGARSIADEYHDSYDAADVVKRYSLYCSILESADQ